MIKLFNWFDRHNINRSIGLIDRLIGKSESVEIQLRKWTINQQAKDQSTTKQSNNQSNNHSDKQLIQPTNNQST